MSAYAFAYSAYRTLASGAIRGAAATKRGKVLASLSLNGAASASQSSELTPAEARAWAQDLIAASHRAERILQGADVAEAAAPHA